MQRNITAFCASIRILYIGVCSPLLEAFWLRKIFNVIPGPSLMQIETHFLLHTLQDATERMKEGSLTCKYPFNLCWHGENLKFVLCFSLLMLIIYKSIHPLIASNWQNVNWAHKRYATGNKRNQRYASLGSDKTDIIQNRY